MKIGAIAILFLAAMVPLCAQEKASEKNAPKTQLEAFAAETGAVIIKGYTELGGVTGMGSVSIDCREFTNAKSGLKKYGVSITVKEQGRLEREDVSYIDFEEIDSLVAGIDYVSKITSSVTKLKNFEAAYSTRGDFSVTVFNDGSNGKLSVAVSSGRIARTSAYLSMEKLPTLKNLILQAKEKLDGLQK